MTAIDPHRGGPIASSGAPPQAAQAGAVLLHGRGDTPEGILRLIDDIYHRGIRYVAPGAAGRVWFPGSFTDPVTDRREAYLRSAIDRVEVAMDELADLGLARKEVAIVGFSQGAAVAMELAIRHPRRYGGLAALAGGLLGPTADLASREGQLGGTPVFCGVGTIDQYVSTEHVAASAKILDSMGAVTSVQTYPGLGHAISDGEIAAINRMLSHLAP